MPVQAQQKEVSCKINLARLPCPPQAQQKGVYIRRVEPTSPVSDQIRGGDILLAFEGTGIANDGTVPFRSGERISFSYLISQKYTGETVRRSLGVRAPQGLCPA
jgi:hypothetical protein